MPNAGDDIEKLYRDLSDNYAFKPKDNGWDGMQQKLDMAGPSVQPPQPASGIAPKGTGILRLYKYLLPGAAAVLLTAVVLVHNNKKQVVGNNGKANSSTTRTQPLTNATVAAPGLPDTQQQATAVTPKQNNVVIKHHDILIDNKLNAYKTNQPYANTTATPLTKEHVDENTRNNNGLAKPNKQQTVTPQANIETGGQVTTVTAQASALQHGEQNHDEQTGRIILMHEETEPTQQNLLTAWQAAVPQQLPEAATHITSLPDGSITTSVSAPVRLQTQPPAYFFTGLTAGPDVSTVKHTGNEKTGLSIGITAGVQITKRMAVKTGLLFEQKNYYSPGRFFWHGDVPPPNQNFLSSVNMHSHLVEVPVTLQYNVVQKRTFSLFVAPGLSSYFISNEKYEMEFRLPFSPERRKFVSQQSYANIFSIFHLSGGLLYKFSKTASVELEPYLKLPLTGIGKGSLPVTSSGVYLSFVYSFLHK